jgi:hypothetical protein
MAYLDRFGARIDFHFLPEMQEISVVCSRVSGCTPALAELLVKAATLTRAAADAEQITAGIGLRRLFAWAELLTDGINPDDAFLVSILNATPDQDKETIRQQCSLAIDASTVARALAMHGQTNTRQGVDPSVSNPTEAGRRAAADFRLAN